MNAGAGVLALLAVAGVLAVVLGQKNGSAAAQTQLTGATDLNWGGVLKDAQGNVIAEYSNVYPSGRTSIYQAPTIQEPLVAGTEGSAATATYTPEYVAATLEYGQELRAEALLNMGYTADQLAQFGIGDAAATIASNLD